MTIWKVQGDINGRLCLNECNNYEIKRKIYNFHQKGYITDWKPVKVTFDSDNKNKILKPIKNITYFFSNTNSFVCDQYAKDLLSDKFHELQFLPVVPVEEEIARKNSYYLINILNCFDALNYESCEFEIAAGICIFDIIKYDIKENAIQYPIFNFSIKGKPFKTIYATDEFKDYVNGKGLSGFVFTEVYNTNNKK